LTRIHTRASLGFYVASLGFYVAVVAMCIAVAACSKVETSAQGPDHAAGHPGVVRIVGAGTIDSLVPELSSSAAASDMAMFWGGWFFLVNDKGQLEPDLVLMIPTKENGGISADGLTITYHLRKGVLWHDGVPLTADDAVFTWHDVIMNPANNVVTRTGYDQVASMDAPDAHTVVVHLKRPYAPATATFFAPSLAPMPVLPKHLLAGMHDINHAAYDNLPVGTGPFIVTKYRPGLSVTLMANPHYWRGPPKLKQIDYMIVSDSNTRAVMMRTGEADIYSDAQMNQLPTLAAIPHTVLLRTHFNEFDYLTFNVTHPPLDDIRVRRALAMGIDKNYIIHTVLHDGADAAVGDQPAYLYTYDPNVPAPKYDPKAAAAMLDAEGWTVGADGFRTKNGKRLELVYMFDREANDGERIGAILQQQFRPLGVDIIIKGIAHSIYYADKNAGGVLAQGKFDIAYEGWIGGMDPDDIALWACDQRGGFNHSFICDPRIDAAERTALTHYDEKTRRAAYVKIQDLLAEDVPVDFLFFQRRNDLIADSLHGYKPAPAVTTFWNSWQWTN
jgi:peptide/nickel transport system substrate-binding protein